MYNVYSNQHLTSLRGITRYIICIFYALAGFAYLSWRLTVFNEDAKLLSVVFYAAELYGFAMSFLIIMVSWKVKIRTPEKASEGLSVDVFITTYNEPLKVIRRTVLGALHIKYPHETWLLDDGNRDEIRMLAHELGCNYLAREKNFGAKAGNLNNGLKHAKGDYVALFDADHVAEPDFLDKTLGYFSDPAVSLVQTPQDYYNSDSFQHGREKNNSLIWHEQSYFHYIGQPGRDYWNAATLCGCSAVLRRSALDDIGGFPDETVTEDMHCAVRLQKRGYKTVYHAEPLAFGIAPADLRSFLRQRLRWGEGNMQVCREEGLPFCKELTLAQRLCYFALTATYLDGWQKLIYYLAPIYVLFTQIPPIWSNLLEFSMYFIPYVLLTMIYYQEMGRGYGRVLATEKYAMTRFGMAIIATMGLFRKQIGFRISSKELAGDLSIFLLLPQIAIFVLGSAALLFTISRPVLGMDLYMPVGITILLALWTLYNTSMAFYVIKDAIRSARIKDEEYQFNVPLPIRFKVTDAEQGIGLIEKISSEQFVFSTRSPVVLDPLKNITGELFLPTRSIQFTASLESLNPDISTPGRLYSRFHCRFFWGNRRQEKDILELSLISCKWHRSILNKYEQVPTFIDDLLGIFARKKFKTQNDRNRQVYLYRKKGMPEHQYNLSYLVQFSEMDQLGIVCTFEELKEGDKITGLLCASDETRQLDCQVVSRRKSDDCSDSDFGSLKMQEYFTCQQGKPACIQTTENQVQQSP